MQPCCCCPIQLHLFTDGRYTIQARDQALGARVHIGRLPVGEQAGKYLWTKTGRGRITAAWESSHITLQESLGLKASAGPKVRWKSAMGLVEVFAAGQRAGRAGRHAPRG